VIEDKTMVLQAAACLVVSRGKVAFLRLQEPRVTSWGLSLLPVIRVIAEACMRKGIHYSVKPSKRGIIFNICSIYNIPESSYKW